jgi:hypothetical protein
MSLQTINLGTLANDGTGDDLRTAFEKVINNFNYLQEQLSFEVQGENVGTGIGVYHNKFDNLLEFNSFVSGNNIRLTLSENNIIVAVNMDSDLVMNRQRILDSGNIELNQESALIGNVVGNLTGSVTPLPGNPIGYGNIVGNGGPALVDGISVVDIARPIQNFDFGFITNNNFDNSVDYMLFVAGMDLGTITAPAPFTIDFGTIPIAAPAPFTIDFGTYPIAQ